MLSPEDAAALNAAFVVDLDRRGVLPSAWMREAVRAVPRPAFVPDHVFVWEVGEDGTGGYKSVDQQTQFDEWRALARTSAPVVTHVNALGDASSSLSDVGAVAEMLHHLGPRAGDRVLEIGTGPGYNAALLAHRIGPDAPPVVSVEIDPAVHALARANLRHCHARPVLGDGAAGFPDAAPYDRVIATASVRAVPYAWVAQSRVGGRIVTPWSGDLEPDGLVILDVGPGGTASGRFAKPVGFMLLRSPSGAAPERPSTWQVVAPDTWQEATPGKLGWDLPALTRDYHALHPASLRLPGVRLETAARGEQWFLTDPASRSWAHADDRADTVRQGGPRRLWDEVEAVLAWLEDEGHPPITEFGLTVGPEGEHAWYRTPDNALTTLQAPDDHVQPS